MEYYSSDKNSKLKTIIAVIVALFLGAGAMYGLISLYPATFIKQITKLEKDVTVNEKGIADSVEKIYDAVVVVSTYKKSGLQGTVLSGTGTGFVYETDDKKAYILTNYHVIEGGSEIHVSFTNGTQEKVTVEGGDAFSDIAVLSIDKDKIVSVAEMGKSEASRIGDTVFVVGSPLADVYSWSVTRGILSGKDRMVEVSSVGSNTQADYVMSVLQTDAAINAGNSGGPLSNSNGEVIGITSMKLVSSGVEGMGFAIPIETALNYAEKILNDESIERPYLGVTMLNVSDAYYSRDYYSYVRDLDVQIGVLITDVDNGSSADNGGIKPGDVIIKMGDTEITSIAYLRYELYNHEVGDTVEVEFYRNGDKKTTKIKLESN